MSSENLTQSFLIWLRYQHTNTKTLTQIPRKLQNTKNTKLILYFQRMTIWYCRSRQWLISIICSIALSFCWSGAFLKTSLFSFSYASSFFLDCFGNLDTILATTLSSKRIVRKVKTKARILTTRTDIEAVQRCSRLSNVQLM